MIEKGFEQTASKLDFEGLRADFNGLVLRVDKIEKEIRGLKLEQGHTNARLATMEADIKDIKRDMAGKYELEDLEGRVKYMEVKLGIESGK